MSYKTKNHLLSSFIYKSSDGLNIKGYKYGKYVKNQNVVVYLRGGNNHPMHKGELALRLNDFTETWLKQAVYNNNCMVYATDYRGSKDSDGNDDIGDKDINDIIGLLNWIKTNRKDVKNVIISAESMGVYKWLQYVSRTKKHILQRKIKLVILQSGVYNLLSMKKERPLLYGHWRKDYKLSDKEIKKRDNKLNLNSINKYNYLLAHGVPDKKAPISEMYKLATDLKNYELHAFKNGDHSLSKYQDNIYNNIKLTNLL